MAEKQRRGRRVVIAVVDVGDVERALTAGATDVVCDDAIALEVLGRVVGRTRSATHRLLLLRYDPILLDVRGLRALVDGLVNQGDRHGVDH